MEAVCGKRLVKGMVEHTPQLPGVYKMISEQGEVLYVGKAKNLQNRISQYAGSNLSPKTAALVSQIHKIDYIILPSEEDALILESNLIREYKPKYNIIFKDDKSFPCIRINTFHPFPSISKCRSRHPDGSAYGPFVSAGALSTVFNILQKVFKLRICSDSYFATRKRPCVQYEVKRCSAPCVNYITKEKYMEDVKQAEMFLQGKTIDLQKLLSKQMETYCESLEYEKAAVIRDRLKAVNSIQQQSSRKIQDCDVIGLASDQELHCLVVFSYRGGQNYGNKVYFPSCQMESESQDILAEFIIQFYRSVSSPPLLLLPIPLAEVAEKAIDMLYKIELRANAADELVQNANANALMCLESKAQKFTHNKQMLFELASLFGMSKTPEKIEVYDNSHIMGKYPTGAVVVATSEGIIKSECRTYKLESSKLHGGDDYAMLSEVLRRRFKKGSKLPDLLIIDGGKGHLSAALEALEGTNAFIVAMAKGKERNAGKETFFLKGREPINLPSDSKLMHYLQRIRDEVHELAINSYRKKHMQSFKSSAFDAIPGVGEARKRALLGHFGSIDVIKKASLEQLEQVPGVGKKFAQKLHASLRSEI